MVACVVEVVGTVVVAAVVVVVAGLGVLGKGGLVGGWISMYKRCIFIYINIILEEKF